MCPITGKQCDTDKTNVKLVIYSGESEAEEDISSTISFYQCLALIIPKDIQWLLYEIYARFPWKYALNSSTSLRSIPEILSC